MKRLITLLAASLGVAAAQAAPVNTVATTGMIADVVRNVAGECAEVTTLMGPGIDPHLYTASAGDVRLFGNADIIFYNGLNLEGQLGEVLSRIGQRIPTVAVAELAAEDQLLEGEDQFEGQPDPHLWMDVSLWAETTDAIVAALSEQNASCEADLVARAEGYQAQLTALHDWVVESIATIPEAQRTLVTAHDAFTYFSNAYTIEVEGIEGISTEAEASIADINEAATVVVETGVPAIFVETTINRRTVEAVQASARDQGAEVEIGGELYGDAMGDDGTPEGTYIGMVRSNVLTITGALGGEVAPWPEALAEWAATWDVASN